jgi:hypothetical protein
LPKGCVRTNSATLLDDTDGINLAWDAKPDIDPLSEHALIHAQEKYHSCTYQEQEEMPRTARKVEMA